MRGIIFTSVFNDIDWTKKRQKPVCTMLKRWQHLRLGGTEIPTHLKENEILSHGKMVARIQFHTSHPIFPATEPLSFEERRKILPFPKYIRQQEDSHQNHFGKQFCIYFYNRICQWYETENLVLKPRRTEDKEQVHLDPEQLTLITQRQWKMTQDQGDSLLQLTENRETSIRRASEASFPRTVENGQLDINQ